MATIDLFFFILPGQIIKQVLKNSMDGIFAIFKRSWVLLAPSSFFFYNNRYTKLKTNVKKHTNIQQCTEDNILCVSRKNQNVKIRKF